MIKIATKLYAACSILSPIIFVILRLTGFYNYPTRNTWIFLFLFVMSLITLFLNYNPNHTLSKEDVDELKCIQCSQGKHCHGDRPGCYCHCTKPEE